MYEIYHIFWANHKQSQAQGSSEAKGSYAVVLSTTQEGLLLIM